MTNKIHFVQIIYSDIFNVNKINIIYNNKHLTNILFKLFSLI